MDTLWQDLRYALRTLRKSPGFTAVAVLTLALGIGTNTAIFSLVNVVMLHPLPFKEGHRLVRLYDIREDAGRVNRVSHSQLNFFAVRERAQSFESVAAQFYQTLALALEEGPERAICIAVSDGWLHTLGVQPVVGRGFTLEEEQAGVDSRAVLLSHGLWQRRFGGDQGIVGSTIVLDDVAHTVVGVMPRGFNYPYHTDMWRLWTFDRTAGQGHFLNAQARLKPGVTLEQARAELEALSKQLEKEYPETNQGYVIWPRPLRESLVGDEPNAILILFAAVGFVLLIACANVANLLLARSVARHKEFAIRSALGASRARQLRQLLTENLLLALLGGGLGVLFTLWIRDFLLVLVPNRLDALVDRIGIDAMVLVFTILLSIAIGAAVALVPAFRSTGLDLQNALKDGDRSGSLGGGRHLLDGLVVAEVALALVLLVGAGLMAQNLYLLQEADLGFDPDNLITMQIALPEDPYAQATPRINLLRQVVDRIQALPDVSGAGVINIFPLTDGGQLTAFIKEGEPEDPEHTRIINHFVVSPGYLEMMKIPLLRGRVFTRQDDAGSLPVVIVSHNLAQRYWPNEDPVGQRVRRATGAPDAPRLTVVGVVGEVVRPERYAEITESWYVPHAQSLATSTVWTVLQPNLAVRTVADPGQALPSIRSAIWQVNSGLPVYDVQTADQYYAATLSPKRVGTVFALAFSAFGLLMAVLGLYGVLSFVVGRRTQEIGVRMALGAHPRDILTLVLRRGAVLVLLGIAIGLGGALALTQVMAGVLSEVSPGDPRIFAGVAVVLSLVGLLACYLPARRAMQVEPMAALRYE
jgi:putative ABC transport system permease protein